MIAAYQICVIEIGRYPIFQHSKCLYLLVVDPNIMLKAESLYSWVSKALTSDYQVVDEWAATDSGFNGIIADSAALIL